MTARATTGASRDFRPRRDPGRVGGFRRDPPLRSRRRRWAGRASGRSRAPAASPPASTSSGRIRSIPGSGSRRTAAGRLTSTAPKTASSRCSGSRSAVEIAEQVTSDPTHKTQPAWSPLGDRIAFTVFSYRAHFWRIHPFSLAALRATEAQRRCGTTRSSRPLSRGRASCPGWIQGSRILTGAPSAAWMNRWSKVSIDSHRTAAPR